MVGKTRTSQAGGDTGESGGAGFAPIVLRTHIRPVTVNQRLGPKAVRKGSKQLAASHTKSVRLGLSEHYRQTKMALWIHFRSQYSGEIHRGPLVVSIWSPYLSRVDVDAHLKILLDSMEGVVYRDDRQVKELHQYESDSGELVIEIAPYSGPGRICPKS